jgi:hypothetical protein
MENTTTPQLKIEDLKVLKEIVNQAVTRGAFNAGECSAIGAVYDKLTVFLNFIDAQEAAKQKAEAEAAAHQEPKGE